MIFTLSRKLFTQWGVTGELWNGKDKMCDTVEASGVLLVPGRYEMVMRYNRKYDTRCLTVKDHPRTALIPRNGPFGLKGSCSVCIGTKQTTGVVLNAHDAATRIQEAVRGNKGKIWLEVI